MIQKTTKTKVERVQSDTVTQGLDNCNEQVAQLFRSKPDLQSVTLGFGRGETVEKTYVRV